MTKFFQSAVIPSKLSHYLKDVPFRNPRLRLLLAVLLITLFVFVFLTRSSSPPDLPAPDKKVILFWTKFFDGEYQQTDNLATCPQSNCMITMDRRYETTASAVVFHGYDLYFYQYDIPFHRTPNQSYVYYILEPPWNPIMSVNLYREPWSEFFNLTWTYRLDADVVSNFYIKFFNPVVGHQWTRKKTAREWLRGKKNRAVAYVSGSKCNSPSGREEYLRELGKVYPVDVFGLCGVPEPVCQGGRNKEECMGQVIGEYKYFLAFENSKCLDYLTEKPFRALNAGTLPIVLGRGPFSELLPNHSYINTADFSSPAVMGGYLRHLDANPSKYEDYFNWRFQPPTTWFPERMHPRNTSLCRLCEILHTPGYQSRSGMRIGDWWEKDSGCQRAYLWYEGLWMRWNRVKFHLRRLLW